MIELLTYASARMPCGAWIHVIDVETGKEIDGVVEADTIMGQYMVYDSIDYEKKAFRLKACTGKIRLELADDAPVGAAEYLAKYICEFGKEEPATGT